MSKFIFVYFCLLGAFVFVETRPWCGNNGCGGGGYSNTQEQYSSQSGYAMNSYSRGGGQSGFTNGGGGYSNGGNSNGGYSNGEYSNGGYSNGGYSNGGYSNGGYSNGGYSNSQYSNGESYDTGYDYNAYVPQDCPNCRVNSFGNGNWNTNTFTIPG